MSYYFTGNEKYDRNVISTAHVHQISRTKKIQMKWDCWSSDSEMDSEDDAELIRQTELLASVNLDADTIPMPSTYSTALGGKRRLERRKRWGASYSSRLPEQDYYNLLDHENIQSLIGRFWDKLSTRAYMNSVDDSKIKVREWIVFFRTLGEVLDDWDSNLCTPIKDFFSGKNKKHSFSKQEFGEFLFHEILAPRVEFSLDSNEYVVFGKNLFCDIYNIEAQKTHNNRNKISKTPKKTF